MLADVGSRSTRIDGRQSGTARDKTPSDLPCIHRGPQIDTRTCTACGHRGENVAVYSCSVYGECSIHNRLAKQGVHAACVTCQTRQDKRSTEPPPKECDVLLCLSTQGAINPSWYDTRGSKVTDLLEDNLVDARSCEMVKPYDRYFEYILRRGSYKVVMNRAMVIPADATRQLAMEYPQTKFVTVCHSSQSDLMRSATWLADQEAHVQNAINLKNCYYAHVDERNHMRKVTDCERCIWMPNAVFMPVGVKKVSRDHNAPLRVSLICAPRDLKNIPNQIVGASIASRILRNSLELVVSIKHGRDRVEPLLRTCGLKYSFREWSSWHNYLGMIQNDVDVGLQVSFTESFNYVALEHMLCGKPVVGSSAIRYLPEGWQVDMDSPEDIAAAICDMESRYASSSKRALDISHRVAAHNNSNLASIVKRLVEGETSS